MELLGELERWFATSLYPNRVPIAVGAAAAAIALLLVARRRGWFAAARRHPRRSLAALAMVAAVGLPSAWYLGSPLFIRTSLDEPVPASPGPTASAGRSPTATPAGAVTAPPDGASAPPALAVPRSGEFRGADDFHFGSGTATLVETAPGEWTVRFESFSVRNGPDLYVYVSPDPDGYAADAIEIGQLRATDGNFNMDLPAGTDPTGAGSIVIWCKAFAVLFAVAPLEG